MAEEIPPICSGCGEDLGPPNEEVHHPDDENPPEDPHFRIQIRDDGEERLQCTVTGQLASPVAPDDEDFRETAEEHGRNAILEALGGGPSGTDADAAETRQDDGPTQSEGSDGDGGSRKPPHPGEGGAHSEVYDIEEEQDQMDILREVVSNPSYGLTDGQIEEIKAWGIDYGGQIPPDSFEEIVGMMEGVQKQTASLMRKRYELKLNKWVQKQSQSGNGPSIGISNKPTSVPSQSPPANPSPSGGPSKEALQAVKEERREKERQKKEEKLEEDFGSGGSSGVVDEVKEGREARKERRREVTSKLSEEVAEEVAQNIGSELGKGFMELRDVAMTALKRKAEKDPDWVLEMSDRLDIDIIDLMEPSEARKKEKREKNSSQSKADRMVDKALDDVESKETSSSKRGSTQGSRTKGMSASPSSSSGETHKSTQPEGNGTGNHHNDGEGEQLEENKTDFLGDEETVEEEEPVTEEDEKFEEVFGDM